KHQRVALVSYTRHFASPELDGSDWLTVWVYSVNEWLTTAELLISEGLRQVREINVGRGRPCSNSGPAGQWTQ
ncbi:MAG: hypothetical protein WB495_02480, partial [Xanthobacteraceae bacterium]